MGIEENARHRAAQIGQQFGRPEVVDDILSGRMSASELLPFLAGLLDQAMAQMFVPITGAVDLVRFDGGAQPPLTAVVTLAEGSQIRVTIEAVES